MQRESVVHGGRVVRAGLEGVTFDGAAWMYTSSRRIGCIQVSVSGSDALRAVREQLELLREGGHEALRRVATGKHLVEKVPRRCSPDRRTGHFLLAANSSS
jgi:hypothetical protein